MPLLKNNPQGWLLAWVVAVLLAAGLVAEVARRTSDTHLERRAAQTATQYAQMIGAAVPDLSRLLAERLPSAEALRQLRQLRSVGEVFRFKMFDRGGRTILVSDDLERPDLGAGTLLGEHHGQAMEQVYTSVLAGRPYIELKDGTGKADRPAAYSEAYVPVVVDGQLLGVIEVYVDQTALRGEVRQAFANVAMSVSAALLLLGGLGAGQAVGRWRAQRKSEERVRYLARHDVLSGTLNRASFNDLLEKAVWRHRRDGRGFAVLCLDLDRFKEVNDSLGHAGGDEVLRQAADRLRSLVRGGDHLARLGGDEFAILQHCVHGAGDVSMLCKRVVAKLAEPFEVAGQRVHCGGSVGAALFGVDASDTAELMHKADLALYRAKTSGRGTFSFYDSTLDEQLQARRELTRDLRQAIDDESLTLHYQKLMAGDGCTLTGYEALLRWHHPTRGNVPPAVSIPLAEEAGLIDALGAWVLRHACHEAVRWPAPLSVAVNLSAAQFRQGDLVGTVRRALEDSGLPGDRLELEITESLLMSDTDRVITMLHLISAMGVRVSMDDFGSGYSSLGYLWRFPFDKVKIDRSFTQALTDDPKVNLVVRSIVSLAHSLNIRVNAEGVETKAQLAMLQKHGCDELQGFLLGRPAPAETLVHTGAATRRPEPVGPSDMTLAHLPTMPAVL